MLLAHVGEHLLRESLGAARQSGDQLLAVDLEHSEPHDLRADDGVQKVKKLS